MQTYCCRLRAEERGEIVRASDRWSVTSTCFPDGTGNRGQHLGRGALRAQRADSGRIRSQKKVQTVALEIAAITSQRQSAVCALQTNVAVHFRCGRHAVIALCAVLQSTLPVTDRTPKGEVNLDLNVRQWRKRFRAHFKFYSIPIIVRNICLRILLRVLQKVWLHQGDTNKWKVLCCLMLMRRSEKIKSLQS